MKRLLYKLDPWEKEMVAQAEIEDWGVRVFVGSRSISQTV